MTFILGSSSSSISAGSRRMNFPKAIRPNAYEDDLISAEDAPGGAASDRNERRLACMVVKPYTGSTRATRASRTVVVASRTCDEGESTCHDISYDALTLTWLQYLMRSKNENTSASRPSSKAPWFSNISQRTTRPYSSSFSGWKDTQSIYLNDYHPLVTRLVD